MKQVLKLTLVLILLFCFFAFVSGLVEDGIRVGLYYAVLGFGSMVFPVLIFVTLYHFLLNNKLNVPNLLLRFSIKSALLILISFIGLFIWAILEFIVTSGYKLDMQWILEDYREEYFGYLPVAIILAVLIPAGHHYFKPRSTS